MTMTLAEAVAITGVDVLDHLDREAAVPVISRIAAQGDVLVNRVEDTPATTPMPRTVIVVRSEASANTHSLHPEGQCFWEYNDRASVTDLTLGKLTIPEGSKAHLIHQEHGALTITPGTYRVGRQREFAGEWAYVAD